MGMKTGVHRIATVVRVLGWVGAAPLVAFAAWAPFSDASGKVGGFVGLLAMGAAVVAMAYGLAWVIDGFADQDH